MPRAETILIEQIVNARLHLSATANTLSRAITELSEALDGPGPLLLPSIPRVDDLATLVSEFGSLVTIARRAGLPPDAVDAATKGDLRAALAISDTTGHDRTSHYRVRESSDSLGQVYYEVVHTCDRCIIAGYYGFADAIETVSMLNRNQITHGECPASDHRR